MIFRVLIFRANVALLPAGGQRGVLKTHNLWRLDTLRRAHDHLVVGRTPLVLEVVLVG